MKKLIFFLILAIAVGYTVFKDDAPPEEKMARNLTKSLIKEHSEGVSFDDHYVQEKGWNEYNVDQYIEVQGNGRQKKRKKVSVRWQYNGKEKLKDKKNWVWTSIEVFDVPLGKTTRYSNYESVMKFFDEWDEKKRAKRDEGLLCLKFYDKIDYEDKSANEDYAYLIVDEFLLDNRKLVDRTGGFRMVRLDEKTGGN